MSEELTLEQQAAAIDNANANPATEQVAQAQTTEQPAQQQAPANITADEFKQFMQQFQSFQNQTQSQLGNFSKKQSELDKFLTSQNKTQAPKSYADLKPEEQASLKELVKHLVGEDLFKDKFERLDKIAESYEAQERNGRILSVANGVLGADFEKYNMPLGDLYIRVKQAAASGDQSAERFLNEIHTTESGVYRMIEMVKAQVSQSLQAQSEKAKLEQEAKAKRAASGVGGGRVQSTSNGADGLPTDKAARMAAMAALIDQGNARR